MKCTKCGFNNKIIDTRHNPGTNTIVRVRECVDCKYKIKTIETELGVCVKNDNHVSEIEDLKYDVLERKRLIKKLVLKYNTLNIKYKKVVDDLYKYKNKNRITFEPLKKVVGHKRRCSV